MRFDAGGVLLDYETAGPRTGLPVVFIHGFPFSKEMWEAQVGLLRGEFHVITYDIRGHGSSEGGDHQYTIELFVNDLMALLDHLKLSRVVVAGLSMGGYIALRAVERHPERFRALILSDTRSEADNNEGKIRRAAQAQAVKKTGMREFADNFVKSIFSEGTFSKNPGAVERIRAIISASDPLAVAGTVIALAARTDTTPSLYTIAIPTLILVGQHDLLAPPSAAHAMKEKIPNAQLHVIPEAAHMSNLENAPEFNKILLQFLRALV